MIYVEQMTVSHSNSRQKVWKELLVKSCVGNAFLSHTLTKENHPGHLLERSHFTPKARWRCSPNQSAAKSSSEERSSRKLHFCIVRDFAITISLVDHDLHLLVIVVLSELLGGQSCGRRATWRQTG